MIDHLTTPVAFGEPTTALNDRKNQFRFMSFTTEEFPPFSLTWRISPSCQTINNTRIHRQRTQDSTMTSVFIRSADKSIWNPEGALLVLFCPRRAPTIDGDRKILTDAPPATNGMDWVLCTLQHLADVFLRQASDVCPLVGSQKRKAATHWRAAAWSSRENTVLLLLRDATR